MVKTSWPVSRRMATNFYFFQVWCGNGGNEREEMEEKKGKKNCHRSDAIESPSTCAILERAPESISMTSKKIIVARKKQHVPLKYGELPHLINYFYLILDNLVTLQLFN